MTRKLNFTGYSVLAEPPFVKCCSNRSSLITRGHTGGLPLNLVQDLEGELESMLASLKWDSC